MVSRARRPKSLASRGPKNGDHRQQVHPPTIIGKLMPVRRQQVTIESKAQKLIVEAQGVVPQADRVGLVEQRVDFLRRFELTHPGHRLGNRNAVGYHGAR